MITKFDEYLNEEFLDPNRPMSVKALESFLKMGFKLMRKSWEPDKYIIMTKPDAKIVLYINGEKSNERLTEEDMRARDWKVIKPTKR
jgi:hypothetical protein